MAPDESTDRDNLGRSNKSFPPIVSAHLIMGHMNLEFKRKQIERRSFNERSEVGAL